MGSALMGSLQMLCCLTEGLFGYSREPTFLFPKVQGHTFFPNLSKIITFAAAPLVLTPFVSNQVTTARGQGDDERCLGKSCGPAARSYLKK